MESIVIDGNRRSSPRPLLATPVLVRSRSTKTPDFLRPTRRSTYCRVRKQSSLISCVAASAPPPTSLSCSSSCNGWDDVAAVDDSDSSSAEIAPFDGKSAALFLLGFVSALAVSRARLSTLAILPVSILIFAAGLLAGISPDDPVGVSWTFRGGGRSRKDGNVSDERRPEGLVRFMEGLDGKMVDLKGGLDRIMRENPAGLAQDEVRRCLDVVESVRVEASPAKKFVGDFVTADFPDGVLDSEFEKSSKGRKEMSAMISEFVKFLGGLFHESLMSATTSRTLKAKDVPKKEPMEQLISLEKHKVNGIVHQNKKNDTDVESEENVQNLKTVEDARVKEESLLEPSIDGKSEKYEGALESLSRNSQVSVDTNFKVDNVGEVLPITSHLGLNGKQSSYARSDKCNDDFIPFKEGQENINKIFNVTSRQGSLEASILHRKSYKRNTQTTRTIPIPSENDSRKFRINSKGEEANVCMLSEFESLQSQSLVGIHKRPYFHSDRKETKKAAVKEANYANGSSGRSGASAVEDNCMPDDLQSKLDKKSISTTSDADGFTEKLQEATELFKQAGEYLRNGSDEEITEVILYKSAELLSAAVTLKPMSLLAVGQLGNTLLLHGELKLKLSREMRTLLSTDDLFKFGKKHGRQLNGSRNPSPSKEEVASVLVNACEECEELLIEAGRKYRMALSIDGSDIRALYNWGLALYFRAELLADVGLEAAFEADRIYLAAIDKFAALTSRSNAHAPAALFKWGLALQQRSNLRSDGSKEKIKLLKQAKSLFEEVLSKDSNNRPVREALMSCLSEIKYSKQF